MVTPDFREPRKLKDLPEEYRARIEWVPWNEILNFLAKMATGDLNSCDQMLRNALVLFLKEVTGLKKYSP